MERSESNAGTGILSVRREAQLPAVVCPSCGARWGTAGREYPSVNVREIGGYERLLDAEVLPLEEWAQLAAAVQPHVPESTPLEPGTEFGPLIGGGRGSFASFHFLRPWTLLARREVITRLVNKGVSGLRPVPCRLTFPPGVATELVELELLCSGSVTEFSLGKNLRSRCGACGRLDATLPSRFSVDCRDVPADRLLFRLTDFSTVIVCRRRFVEVLETLGLTGLKFEPLASIR